MSVALIVIAYILGIAGIIGSVVPGLPGPPISWAGLLVAYFAKSITTTTLLIWLAITIIVTVLDYVIPAKFTRMSGGSKAGSWGATIGLLAGILFTAVGMIAGCFAGALVGELIFGRREPGASFKSALGAFAGVMAGTGIKLVATVTMMFYII
ncbi:MAG: DUF456 domain-containing protein [Spirochaetia bacterium]|nr:DUF456 domain-containing protein [Spirochaetia bacterium]MBQ3712651.1 DUF456 domain-containing protein [Spirochaetia bacterium]MBR0318849.1 DUF456 domain-containing protein [Spirochaetia bacterium]